MNCLAQRKRFKNKHPVWEDTSDPKLDQPVKVVEESAADEENESNSSSDDDDAYELIAGEVRSSKVRLEANELIYKHLTNINDQRSFTGGVRQVQFHPNSRMALVTLARNQVDLYEVDGERNRYLQNIRVPRTREPYCAFTPDGNSIVISSDNYLGKFFVYDMLSADIKKYALKVGKSHRDMTDFRIHGDYMACRKEGDQEVLVLSSKTYENAFSLKLNEPARAIRFSNDNDILIAGENSNIYIWDVRKTSLCKHRFHDEGSVHTSSLALSETCRSLSIGSDCGVLNTYELDDCLGSRFPKPTKTYTNLNDPIDILEYNHSGELLLFGSSQKSEAFRMSHTISGTVYRNFPITRKIYGKLSSACFSPLSGYLTFGTSRGRAFLCRLPYYKSY